MVNNMKKISLLLVLFICLFTVIGCKNDNKPKIYSITPTSGLVEGGNKVSIYGEKLPDGLNIYFGDNKATVESQSDSAVVVTVPKGKVGEVINGVTWIVLCIIGVIILIKKRAVYTSITNDEKYKGLRLKAMCKSICLWLVVLLYLYSIFTTIVPM